MTQHPTAPLAGVSGRHRRLLVAGAFFTTLLVAMGGILCVTDSIRNCPDWPGCFGRLVPPLETGPILEYTHRVLAAISGLVMLSAVIVGWVRTPRLRLVSISPLIAILLAVEVSYFGAMVVLRGLSPGWAAVDVGSALLVVALMVTAAVAANAHWENPGWIGRLKFQSPFARLVLLTTLVVYVVLLSGVLVAGKFTLAGCIGWPFYNPILIQDAGHVVGYIIRLVFSIAGVGMLTSIVVQAWRKRVEHPGIYRYARWMGIVFILELLVQVLLLVFGMPVQLLVVYTVTAAVFWALLVALLAQTGVEGEQA